MGATYGRTVTPDPEPPNVSSELHPNNGLVFNDWFLPPEVVSHILTYFEPILNGRRVCRAWRDMIDSVVVREKISREIPGANAVLALHKNLTWEDYYFFYSRKPHLRNLLKNGSAEERWKHWTGVGTGGGGSKWIIERTPVGCGPFPPGVKQCFTTSFSWCSAEQLIYLEPHGLTPAFMKHVRPNIHIEEWYTGRFDCGSIYSLKVSLLNRALEVIDSFAFESSDHGNEWLKVEHVFRDYDGVVDSILFHHKGKDTQFWAGNYGSKMTGAKVYITLPSQATSS